MRVGILGGSFDPIHLGHLFAAEAARESQQLDQVWFMPAAIPPHKQVGPQASPAERLEMIRRAITGNPFFHIEDIELRTGGISYTIDSVRMLQKRNPEHEFYFIVGADMVAYLPEWHRAEELLRMIRFIGLLRPGTELHLEHLPPYVRSRVHIVEAPLIEISSTDIRRRIAARRSIRYMVPEAVYDYVKENKLYGEPQGV